MTILDPKMVQEDEAKDTLLAKILVDNPLMKMVTQIKTERQEFGKRPWVDWVRDLTWVGRISSWNRNEGDPTGKDRILDRTTKDK